MQIPSVRKKPRAMTYIMIGSVPASAPAAYNCAAKLGLGAVHGCTQTHYSHPPIKKKTIPATQTLKLGASMVAPPYTTRTHPVISWASEQLVALLVPSWCRATVHSLTLTVIFRQIIHAFGYKLVTDRRVCGDAVRGKLRGLGTEDGPNSRRETPRMEPKRRCPEKRSGAAKKSLGCEAS